MDPGARVPQPSVSHSDKQSRLGSSLWREHTGSWVRKSFLSLSVCVLFSHRQCASLFAHNFRLHVPQGSAMRCHTDSKAEAPSHVSPVEFCSVSFSSLFDCCKAASHPTLKRLTPVFSQVQKLRFQFNGCGTYFLLSL